MKPGRRDIKGVTLLELLLVLVIMGAIFMLALQQYWLVRRDADVAMVKYNVNQLFGAAAEYYQANCRMQIDPSTGDPVGSYGTLDPKYNPQPTDPYPVTVDNLRTGGFFPGVLKLNPLVNNAGMNNGYIVQFNQSATTKRQIRTPYAVGDVDVGDVIVWRVQVAVEVRANRVTATSMVQSLGGDCLSTRTGTTVTPCSSVGVLPPGGTYYVVWERLPSFAVPDADPNSFITNAQSKKFNQQYTNNTVVWDPDNLQNYLCGS